jgi:hypothetical protein
VHEKVSIVVQKSIELLSDDVVEGHSNIAAAQVDIFSQTSYKEKYPQLLTICTFLSLEKKCVFGQCIEYLVKIVKK